LRTPLGHRYPSRERGPGQACPLADLSPGRRAVVATLSATGLARRRLLDLGLTTEATVEVIRSSPLGDPTAYLIRGAIIALRRRDAAGITVIPAGHEAPSEGGKPK